MEWHDRAACKDYPNVAAFFPERGHARVADEARAICQSCPVKQPCLQFALDWTISHGVWGGLTENEREPLRQQLATCMKRCVECMDPFEAPRSSRLPHCDTCRIRLRRARQVRDTQDYKARKRAS